MQKTFILKEKVMGFIYTSDLLRSCFRQITGVLRTGDKFVRKLLAAFLRFKTAV